MLERLSLSVTEVLVAKEDLETNYWPEGKTIYGNRLNGTGIGASAEYSAVRKLEQTLSRQYFNV